MAKISIIGQIGEVEREIAMRERVYPQLVAASKMKSPEADMLMERMRAVLATLRFVQTYEKDFREYYAAVHGKEPQ
jgi:hypothetical protein